MKYHDAFRSKEPLQAVLSRIQSFPPHPISLMEVCGTHTVSISKFGLRSLLPSHIRLVGSEVELINADNRENRLKAKLGNIRDYYEYIF